jgi:hypothetical protein
MRLDVQNREIDIVILHKQGSSLSDYMYVLLSWHRKNTVSESYCLNHTHSYTVIHFSCELVLNLALAPS